MRVLTLKEFQAMREPGRVSGYVHPLLPWHTLETWDVVIVPRGRRQNVQAALWNFRKRHRLLGLTLAWMADDSFRNVYVQKLDRNAA